MTAAAEEAVLAAAEATRTAATTDRVIYIGENVRLGYLMQGDCLYWALTSMFANMKKLDEVFLIRISWLTIVQYIIYLVSLDTQIPCDIP